MGGGIDGWSRAGRLRGSPPVGKRIQHPRVHFLVAVVGLLTLVGVMMIVHLRPDSGPIAHFPGTQEGELFQCDRSQFRTDICNLRGDIRLEDKTFVLYAQESNTNLGREVVKPYTRKWEKSCMDIVEEVALISVPASRKNPKACDVIHKVPGVVFSNGGYTGNLYHEFNDGLIPLFITSQHLQREVVFVVSEFHNWWFTKYNDLLMQMSRYPLLNLENDTRVHCFPEIEAGLHIHEELGVDPDRMPHHETICDFRDMLNRAYTPELSNTAEDTVVDNIYRVNAIRKPQLTIVLRSGTRKFLNLDNIVHVAVELGFNVTLLIPDPTMELRKIYRLLNSTDVLLGVHGAAMTHFLFMRPGTAVIQVIPLGTDWAANEYYAEPAVKLGLHYFPYKIIPAESSLSEKYSPTSPVLTDPMRIAGKGWWTMKEIYLENQNVRPSPARMRRVLWQALYKLRHFKAPSSDKRREASGRSDYQRAAQ